MISLAVLIAEPYVFIIFFEIKNSVDYLHGDNGALVFELSLRIYDLDTGDPNAH